MLVNFTGSFLSYFPLYRTEHLLHLPLWCAQEVVEVFNFNNLVPNYIRGTKYTILLEINSKIGFGLWQFYLNLWKNFYHENCTISKISEQHTLTTIDYFLVAKKYQLYPEYGNIAYMGVNMAERCFLVN